jgi:hypothetical protein
MQNSSIEKLVEETINSLDGTKRAEAKPFLLTRIFARMQNQDAPQNIWTKAGSFLSTPRVALAGLLLIIILNATIIMQYTGAIGNPAQNTTTAKDDFAINVISIYDIENQEP